MGPPHVAVVSNMYALTMSHMLMSTSHDSHTMSSTSALANTVPTPGLLDITQVSDKSDVVPALNALTSGQHDQLGM